MRVALHGPERAGVLPQRAIRRGREAQFDFTHCGVNLQGDPAPDSPGIPHDLLFQLILSHSGWRYAEVAAD